MSTRVGYDGSQIQLNRTDIEFDEKLLNSPTAKVIQKLSYSSVLIYPKYSRVSWLDKVFLGSFVVNQMLAIISYLHGL